MKIGVITFSQTKDNYGQILQCYAMQKYLQKLGHHPFLIQYISPAPPKAHFKISKLGIYFKNFSVYIKWFFLNRALEKQKIAYEESTKGVDRKFSQFLKENIELTPIYTKEQLKNNPPEASAYICGSDQIWKYDDIYYLSFVPQGKMRIAYAPSFGGESHFPIETERMIKQELESFSFLGIREELGVKLCHRLGFLEAVKVVDPTLLLSKEDYDKVKSNIHDKNYIFVYLLGNPTECTIDEIQNYAKSLKKKVIYVCSQGKHDSYDKTYATIEEWLGYISNADIIITNSFHCIVFSLIYNRQFVALPLNKGYEKMNGRLVDLLYNIGLENRIWNNNLTKICGQVANFDRFNQHIMFEQNRVKKIFVKLLDKQ